MVAWIILIRLKVPVLVCSRKQNSRQDVLSALRTRTCTCYRYGLGDHLCSQRDNFFLWHLSSPLPIGMGAAASSVLLVINSMIIGSNSGPSLHM